MEELKAALKKYADNYDKIAYLVKYKFSLDCEEDTILSNIAENSVRIQSLKNDNDRILNTYIYPLIHSDKPLGQAESALLQEFVKQHLQRKGNQDLLLCLKIFDKFLRDAKVLGDDNEIIHDLYECGILAHRYRSAMVQKRNDLLKNPYFEECYTTYFDRYHEFDEKTRDYLVRAMHNHSTDFGYETEEQIDEAAQWLSKEWIFITDENNQKESPSVPWKLIQLACNTQISNLMNGISAGRGMAYVPMVLSACERIAGKQDYWDVEFNLKNYYQYIQKARAEYYAGLKSCHELIEILMDVYDHRMENDETADGVSMNMLIPSFILSYIKDDEERTEGEKQALMSQLNHQIYQYINAFHFEGNETRFSREISNFISSRSSETDLHEWKKQMERIFIGIHPPTYIHSKMVSLIAREIMREVICEKPELLIGLQSIQCVEDVLKHQEELLAYIEDASFLHDIGKLYVLGAVGQYGRRLMDEEFALLKEHPLYSETRLKTSVDTNIFVSVARHHHVFFNGTGGYPKAPDSWKSCNHIDVDIVTVSDCIDAATDGIGRCYTIAKSFDTLMDEFKRDAGVRYHPVIVEILEKPSLKKRIEKLLSETRNNTYIEVFKKIQAHAI